MELFGLNHVNTGDVNNSDKFVASFWGELQLWDNLKFKTTYGADLAFWGNDGWIYPYYLGKSNSQTQSSPCSRHEQRIYINNWKMYCRMTRPLDSTQYLLY